MSKRIWLTEDEDLQFTATDGQLVLTDLESEDEIVLCDDSPEDIDELIRILTEMKQTSARRQTEQESEDDSDEDDDLEEEEEEEEDENSSEAS